MRTSITPEGHFLYTVHEPDYTVKNLRKNDFITNLGHCDGNEYLNRQNFPADDITVEKADRIYEIPNVFPFKGTTFINSRWADARAEDPSCIKLPEPGETSFCQNLAPIVGDDANKLDDLFSRLPDALLLALATSSTDPDDLVRLAKLCCEFLFDSDNVPQGFIYQKGNNGSPRALISNHPLFEAVANNPHLPSSYKQCMVLRPGAQGSSEIVGEWDEKGHHVFEYLRRNSYIPWGHFASNMANDAVRYSIKDLSLEDMRGLRHLYYQRTYVRLAELLDIALPRGRQSLSPDGLEEIRLKIEERLGNNSPAFDRTMWGWNYGFDFAPSLYRLNASHQQIHQQFAMLPAILPQWQAGKMTDKPYSPFACGDMIAEYVHAYHKQHNRSFFDDLIANIRNNRRMDGKNSNASLIIHEDEHVMLFVPKAQTSQWELQLLCLQPMGNILEADISMRTALDTAMHTAMQVLGALRVKMVTTIEYNKRFGENSDQRLLYCFLPKLPKSPGAFSEAQLRWIMGHFPEDFAAACRNKITK